MSEPVEVVVTLGDEEVTLTEANTTVYSFREAKHMNHVYYVREDGYTVIFDCDALQRQLIDLDFPLQTSRWPRQCDFDAFELYIDKLAAGLSDEIDHMGDNDAS